MDDIKLALLGDHEAAKRLTDAGVLVPCWHCGGTDIVIRKVDGLFGKSAHQRTYKYAQCRTCFSQTGYHGTEPKTRLAWNTRAPILSAEDISDEERRECKRQGATGYWIPTRANAIRPLYQLVALAQMRPDGIWEGD